MHSEKGHYVEERFKKNIIWIMKLYHIYASNSKKYTKCARKINDRAMEL